MRLKEHIRMSERASRLTIAARLHRTTVTGVPPTVELVRLAPRKSLNSGPLEAHVALQTLDRRSERRGARHRRQAAYPTLQGLSPGSNFFVRFASSAGFY